MADTKITDLTAITSGVASTDVTVLVDVSDTTMAASGTDKKITVGDLATAITTAGSLATDTEVASAISALSAVYQPLDSDLTAIAALTTTTFGRSLLVLADAAAGRTALGLGSLATASTITSSDITDGTIVDGDINASAAIALSKLASDPLARANHTGTQTASTISDFAETVRDTMGTALVAGSNVTITVNDPGDTITIAATGGGGSFSFDDSGAWLASQFWS